MKPLKKPEYTPIQIAFWIGVIIVQLVVFYSVTAGASAVPLSDTAVWLARSCVGEAGFRAHRTGECASIMHIYRKRAANDTPAAIEHTARKYSAAIRPRVRRGNRWVMHLRRDMQRPDHWPSNIPWDPAYSASWARMLAHADAFLRGEVTDPTPRAMHYGGRMDRLADRAGWRVIRGLNYRNIFYRPAPLGANRLRSKSK